MEILRDSHHLPRNELVMISWCRVTTVYARGGVIEMAGWPIITDSTMVVQHSLDVRLSIVAYDSL
jgi:hypothetical protein